MKRTLDFWKPLSILLKLCLFSWVHFFIFICCLYLFSNLLLFRFFLHCAKRIIIKLSRLALWFQHVFEWHNVHWTCFWIPSQVFYVFFVESHSFWNAWNPIEMLNQLHPSKCFPKNMLLLFHLVLCLRHTLRKWRWNLFLNSGFRWFIIL